MEEENPSIYKPMYYYLFNRVTDALRALENERAAEAAQILMDAQIACEERYMEE